MLLALAVVYASETGLDAGTLERLGTAGVVAVVLLAIITWLLRDRAQTAERHAAELAAERTDKARVIAQRDGLFDQLVVAERSSATTLATVAPILQATNQELRLARERTG